MKTLHLLGGALGLAILSTTSSALAGDECNDPASGPDVIVGDIPDVGNYGVFNGMSAFSLATTSCNIGTEELNWIASNNQHPVIGQNIYRYEDGRFEQLGLSWLKHGFTALQQGLCCTCISSGTGSRLGVGCSDPYSAGLNGSQSGLGPRFEVNAHTGQFNYPYTGQGQSGNTLYKRIQIDNDDLDPAQHPNAFFYGEGHYVALDDAAWGNGNNNASYRPLRLLTFEPNDVEFDVAGATVRKLPAIWAWQAKQPTVQIEEVQVPNEGLFLVGSHATDNGDGTWHYEYAVQNLNSHVSGGSFSVPVPDGVVVSNIEFNDVDYHSGEPWDTNDWAGSHASGSVTWATDSFGSNQNANAIRWGTLYNFRFDADTPPTDGSVDLGLFRPHTPSSMDVPASVPDCSGPIAGSQTVRLGSPANPNAFLPGTSAPVAGETWDPRVDHTSFFPAATGDFLMLNLDGAQINVPTIYGTLLCNVPSSGLVFFNASPGTPFSLPIPELCILVGLDACSQGGSFDAVDLELANALDLTIGNL